MHFSHTHLACIAFGNGMFMAGSQSSNTTGTVQPPLDGVNWGVPWTSATVYVPTL